MYPFTPSPSCAIYRPPLSLLRVRASGSQESKSSKGSQGSKRIYTSYRKVKRDKVIFRGPML